MDLEENIKGMSKNEAINFLEDKLSRVKELLQEQYTREELGDILKNTNSSKYMMSMTGYQSYEEFPVIEVTDPDTKTEYRLFYRRAVSRNSLTHSIIKIESERESVKSTIIYLVEVSTITNEIVRVNNNFNALKKLKNQVIKDLEKYFNDFNRKSREYENKELIKNSRLKPLQA